MLRFVDEIVDIEERAIMETISAQELTFLETADHEVFFSALDELPEPTEALRSAFKRYSETVISR